MTPGSRIRERRNALKLTQERLAAELGLKNRQSVNRIEKGLQAVSAEQAAKLAPLLQCSPAWLLFGSEVCIGVDFASGPSSAVVATFERGTNGELKLTGVTDLESRR